MAEGIKSYDYVELCKIIRNCVFCKKVYIDTSGVDYRFYETVSDCGLTIEGFVYGYLRSIQPVTFYWYSSGRTYHQGYIKVVFALGYGMGMVLLISPVQGICKVQFERSYATKRTCNCDKLYFITDSIISDGKVGIQLYYLFQTASLMLSTEQVEGDVAEVKAAEFNKQFEDYKTKRFKGYVLK